MINSLLWDEESGIYTDFNFETGKRTGFESATMFYPLWAGLCSERQAESLVQRGLPILEEAGGIASTSARSRGEVSAQRPPRQWDYPVGWAPHQMLLWAGLERYGYKEEAQRLSFKWLQMMTQNAMDYNGVISEKYDVVLASHQVDFEYGNVGTNFEYFSGEGFGWSNASFQVGLKMLSTEQRKALDALKASDDYS